MVDFKRGDLVSIKDEYKHCRWYTTDIYIILYIYDDDIVLVDKNVPYSVHGNGIHIKYIKKEIKFLRKQKLQKIWTCI